MTIHRCKGHSDAIKIAGMTMAQIVEYLDVPRSTVYRWRAKENKLFAAWVAERERSNLFEECLRVNVRGRIREIA